MLDLHMHIYNELVNVGLHWHLPMASSWHAPTKHANISMRDLGKPPSYKGSSNCRPYKGAQLENLEGESICHKPFLSPLKVFGVLL
jgi:hypothetical protein